MLHEFRDDTDAGSGQNHENHVHLEEERYNKRGCHDISITGCTVNGAKNAFLSFTGSENSTEGTDYNISVSDLAFAYNGTSAKSAEENTCVLKNLKDCTFTDIRFYGITDPWDREDATLRNVTVK